MQKNDHITDTTERVERKNYKPTIVYSQSLEQIIEKYEMVCTQLHLIADEVPSEATNVDELIAREQKLFDRHATLLNDALNMEIQSIGDANAIMRLWKNEVIGDRENSMLTAGDKIVLSVCKFLEAK